MTDLGAVLEQLKKERAQLDKAITALSGVVGIEQGHRRTRVVVRSGPCHWRPAGRSQPHSGHDGQRSVRRKRPRTFGLGEKK